MLSKCKLMRLFTLQHRLESVIKDFSNSSDVSDDVINVLYLINNSLSDLIEHVRS